MRVLVADDHDALRTSICTLISTYSTLAVCGVASDGEDAVEKALSLRPDLVLMDIRMPTVNGLEATRKLKRLLPETRIVIVSNESPEIMLQAVNAGATGYVTKSRVVDLLTEIEETNRHELFEIVEPGSENATSE